MNMTLLLFVSLQELAEAVTTSGGAEITARLKTGSAFLTW